MTWIVALFGVFSAVVAVRTGHWLAAVAVIVLVFIQLWRRPRSRLLSPEPELKGYPVGCTCVFGALLDNPSCPHHGGGR